MSTNYIELSSAFRNRAVWPSSAEFQIPIMQSGVRGDKSSAVDPVSDAAPLFAWTSNRLSVVSGASVSVQPLTGSTSVIGSVSSSQSVVLEFSNDCQQLANYYNRLVLYGVGTPSQYLTRIFASRYYGWGVNAQVDFLLSVSDEGLSAPVGVASIYDPTDFTDAAAPVVFVPAGNDVFLGSYYNLILYNETLNEYRPIASFDTTYSILRLNTSGSTSSSAGPLSAEWRQTDNFSIRRAPPLLPILGARISTGTAPFVVLSATDTSGETFTTSMSVIVVADPALSMSAEVDAYRNEFLRILPFGSFFATNDLTYLYTPAPTNNQMRRILSYRYVEDGATPGVFYGVFVVDSDFDTTLANLNDGTDGAPVEILQFSRDNYTPLNYNGTLLSSAAAYEVSLQSICLPNQRISGSNGGFLRDYPYIYVQLSNVSSPSRATLALNSNSPGSTSAVFKCTVYDINITSRSPFVRVDGSGIVAKMVLNPNDCLYLKVWLPDGTLFRTRLAETQSPAEPLPLNQVSAMFKISRLAPK